MNRLILAVVMAASLSAVPAVSAQSVYPGQFDGLVKVASADAETEWFDLKDVELLPGRFHDNMRRDSAWMVNVAASRLLHSFYTNAGLYAGREGGYMTVKKLGGWESLDCELRGHTTGHLMSAHALMYAATGDDVFKQKGDILVAGLRKVQEALGNGYVSAFPEELINRNIGGTSVWAPWYTLHKLLSGLIDQYLYAGNDTALTVATGFGDWAYRKLENVDDETRRRMIRNEFGGINEAFYNLYAVTADERYRQLAEFFYHNDVIDPLKDGRDELGTKHTNTFIPKVIAEMRRYELLGDSASLALSRYFWERMTGAHTFAPGCSSDKEHYFDTSRMSEHVSGYTGETCCTYNMLKLTRHLFSYGADAGYMDYYERALYNHILGQQDPSTGMVAYFLPLRSGCHRVYSTPENSFWCCVGSGFESHAKYAETIYSHSPDNSRLYVNLFIPSRLKWRGQGMTLTQTTGLPKEGCVNIAVEAEAPVKCGISLRHPRWARSMTVKVNGRKVSARPDGSGYAVISRRWKTGDRIEVEYGMDLYTERTPDNPDVAALLYGPVVLAGDLGTDGMAEPAPHSDPSKYNDYYTYDYHIPEGLSTGLNLPELRRVSDLEWITDAGVRVVPLSDLHRRRYVVYWDMKH